MKYLLCFLFLTFSGHSQELKWGSIHLSNGENLNGYIEFSVVYAGIQKKNPRVFYSPNLNGSKKQSFRAKEVDSVLINGEVIYSIPVEKKCAKLFFRVLCEGKYPLLVFNMVNAGGPNFGFLNREASEYWIWKKDKNKAVPMKTTYSSTKSFKSCLKNNLHECPELFEQYDFKKLKKMEPVEIYKIYNLCFN